ncbi:MAG: hypothetical protein ACREQR_14680 [Candidatus Binataceae bacterium]
MKLVGILVILLGWLIAVSSVTMGSVGVQLAVAALGFVVSFIGIVAILNRAHNANAIWKQ